LLFCIGPFAGADHSWPLWISARIRSHSRTGPRRPFGSPDHGRDGETVCHILKSNSQTSGGHPFGIHGHPLHARRCGHRGPRPSWWIGRLRLPRLAVAAVASRVCSRARGRRRLHDLQRMAQYDGASELGILAADARAADHGHGAGSHLAMDCRTVNRPCAHTRRARREARAGPSCSRCPPHRPRCFVCRLWARCLMDMGCRHGARRRRPAGVHDPRNHGRSGRRMP